MLTAQPRLWVRLLPRAAFGSLVALSCIALIGQLSPIISYHTQNLAIYVDRGSPSGGPGNRGRAAIGRAYQDTVSVGLPVALFDQEDTEGFVGPRGSADVAVKVEMLSSAVSSRTLAAENTTGTRERSWLVKKPSGQHQLENHTDLTIPDSYAVVDPAKKKRILLLAYFRSGSSFLGGLLSSTSNRTFFSYEPLSLLSAAERLDSLTAPRGLEILANHLTVPVPSHRWNHYAPNAFLMKLCARKVKVCLNPHFMADVCRRSPVQVVKVTRLSVVQLRRNLRVVYLVRDPRGMISSRSVMSWCRKSATCMNASSLCREMNEDLDAFEELRELLPEATVRVRYEDVAKSPVGESKALFRALRLDFSAGVMDFLGTHTAVNDTKVLRNPYSTFRQSSATAFRWTKRLSWDRVKEIQATCAPILKRLGYEVFRNEKELKEVLLR
ncbi:hypothetical protein HPB52_017048 [Rhipicephalus sanguineus]|uniref:Uncharacterized protein n=1 Tax=Rhipicephalus sanguineus TaxID=34632 RepID=A0A9D4T5U3_RHISA|nr:hypothetical protein HPB52_017048 [Rhipicephalus sanguineus]